VKHYSFTLNALSAASSTFATLGQRLCDGLCLSGMLHASQGRTGMILNGHLGHMAKSCLNENPVQARLLIVDL